jgi:hypothetical protein
VRWQAPCGCTNGWNFEANLWKIPFKVGLTRGLVDLHRIYEESTSDLLRDPMLALSDYINLKIKAIDRTLQKADLEGFIDEHFKGGMDGRHEVLSAITMMDGIYHMEAAQTSCATFHDNPYRLEPRYDVIHAANAMRLFVHVLPNNGALDRSNLCLEKALLLSNLDNLRTYWEAIDSGSNPEHTHIKEIMDFY